MLNKNSIVITTNPANMKLMGVPKLWVKKQYCDRNIVDETNMNDFDFSENKEN